MIYHWCSEDDWRAASDSYEAASLAEEGFIHFSFRDQVERTATTLERGKLNLVLLCVDETGLEIVLEDSYGGGEEFPHIYGPIPAAAVVRVFPFPPEADGSFLLPEGV